MRLIMLYLAAVVAANLTVAAFGPPAAVLNALLFIGLDLTTRDRLHERWQGHRLWPRMAALIAGGSLLTWLLNRDAGPIAAASLVAFAAAGALDAAVYTALRRRPTLVRVNGSNAASALVDSLLFPWLAFGSLEAAIVLGLFGAKVVGGAVWAMVLSRPRSPA